MKCKELAQRGKKPHYPKTIREFPRTTRPRPGLLDHPAPHRTVPRMSETSRSLHDRIEKARQAGAAYAAATTPQQAAQATAAINALLAAPPITATITTKARAT